PARRRAAHLPAPAGAQPHRPHGRRDGRRRGDRAAAPCSGGRGRRHRAGPLTGARTPRGRGCRAGHARERRGRGRATPGAGAVSAAAGGGGGGGGPGERRALVVPAGRTHLRRRLPRSVRPAGRGAPGTSAVTAARRTTGPRGGRPYSGRHAPGPARLRTPSGPSPSAFRPSRPSCLPSSAAPPTVERDVVTAPEAPLSAPPAPMSRRQILQAMSGLMAGMFVAILAGTVVANALPTIITDLNASQSAYTWVVTSELLAMTATVPLWGK